MSTLLSLMGFSILTSLSIVYSYIASLQLVNSPPPFISAVPAKGTNTILPGGGDRWALSLHKLHRYTHYAAHPQPAMKVSERVMATEQTLTCKWNIGPLRKLETPFWPHLSRVSLSYVWVSSLRPRVSQQRCIMFDEHLPFHVCVM